MPDLAERYSVTSLGVFGSRVRGDADEESDLDILVEFEDAPTFWEFIGLERELGVKVDLVMKKTLKPQIGAAILKEVVAV